MNHHNDGGGNRGIHAGVIDFIFTHLHTALRTEGNMFDITWLQAAKELVKIDTWWKFSYLGVMFREVLSFKKNHHCYGYMYTIP